jgi:hypothetical protein
MHSQLVSWISIISELFDEIVTNVYLTNVQEITVP